MYRPTDKATYRSSQPELKKKMCGAFVSFNKFLTNYQIDLTKVNQTLLCLAHLCSSLFIHFVYLFLFHFYNFIVFSWWQALDINIPSERSMKNQYLRGSRIVKSEKLKPKKGTFLLLFWDFYFFGFGEWGWGYWDKENLDGMSILARA